MSDTQTDIDALLTDLVKRSRFGWHTALAALIAERDDLRRENEAQTYNGNSVSYWHQKAKAYGGCVDSLWIVLSAAGYQPDGVKHIVDALTALVAERDALVAERDRLRAALAAAIEDKNEARQRLRTYELWQQLLRKEGGA